MVASDITLLVHSSPSIEGLQNVYESETPLFYHLAFEPAIPELGKLARLG
jgi:hypothetical protein